MTYSDLQAFVGSFWCTYLWFSVRYEFSVFEHWSLTTAH